MLTRFPYTCVQPSLNNSSYSDPTPTLAPSRPRSSIELNLWSIPPIMLLYGFLLASTFRSLQGMTHVHDRFGLAFTYVIELACSTVRLHSFPLFPLL
jgi:hypothetical protein